MNRVDDVARVEAAAPSSARGGTADHLRGIQLRAAVAGSVGFVVLGLVPGLFGPGRAWWLLAAVPVYAGFGVLLYRQRDRAVHAAGIAVFACVQTSVCGVLAESAALRCLLLVATLMAPFNAAMGLVAPRLVRVITAQAVAGTSLIMATWPDAGPASRLIGVVAIGALATQPPTIILRYRGRLEAARARAEELASTDPLTGLLNRRGLAACVPRLLERASAQGTRVAVLAIDLDHFKQVNDRYGHATGDDVLRRVADTVRASVRQLDVVARIGGEEICVLALLDDADDAARLAERIRRNVERDASAWGTTVSAGGVELRPDALPGRRDPVDEIWAVLDRADGLMYEAKHAGRNLARVEAA